MRRKMFLAAILPLPFAAIPVLAVAFGSTTAPDPDVAYHPAPVFEIAPDVNVIRIQPPVIEDSSLAYTGAEDKYGCIEDIS